MTFQKNLELFPEHVKSIYMLGLIYFKGKNDLPMAKDMLERLKELDDGLYYSTLNKLMNR